MSAETTTRRDARSTLEQLFGRGDLPPPRFEFFFRSAPPALAVDDWHVRSFQLREAIGEPYRALIELVGPETDWEAADLLGQRAELLIFRGDDFFRPVHGVVRGVEYLGSVARGHRVRVTMGPALAMLEDQRRSRIFQDLSVLEIAEKVLGPVHQRWGSSLVADHLAGTYEPIDYRVQYDETDLHFLLRILAEAGIQLLFDHRGTTEIAVLCDSPSGLPLAGLDPLDPHSGSPPQIPRWHGEPNTIPVESITLAQQSVMPTHAQWTTRQWDWKSQPPAFQASTVAIDDDASGFGESVRWAPRRPDQGPRTDEAIADGTGPTTRLRATRDRAATVRLVAESTCTTLRAGSVFELEPQRRDRFEEPWCVVAIEHQGDAPHVDLRGAANRGESTLTNRMHCRVPSVAHVASGLEKPRAHGMTTAVVTGPPGEAIHTDEHGRVRVRMLWDADGPADDTSSCWLRVVQPWAGSEHGMTYIPRVGSEVAVSFIDGDPDRPICWGGLHNGASRPIHALPANRASTVLRTQHVDNPERFHELRFNDSPGSERVSLRADGGLCETVRGPHRTTVGGSRKAVVKGDRSVEYEKDNKEEVRGDHNSTVHGKAVVNALDRLDLHVSSSPGDHKDAGFRTTVAFGKYEVLVEEGIVFKCGDCTFEISRHTVTIEAPAIIAKTTGDSGEPASTLSLSDGHAVTEAASIQSIATGSKLRLDQTIKLLQGTGETGASVALGGGDVLVTAGGGATVEGQRIGMTSKGETKIEAGSLTVGSGSSASVVTAKGATVSAGDDLVLRGKFVRIN